MLSQTDGNVKTKFFLTSDTDKDIAYTPEQTATPVQEVSPDSTKQESRNGSEKEAADIRSPETG